MSQRTVWRLEVGDQKCRGEVLCSVPCTDKGDSEKRELVGKSGGFCPHRRRKTEVLFAVTTAVGALLRAGFDHGRCGRNTCW